MALRQVAQVLARLPDADGLLGSAAVTGKRISWPAAVFARHLCQAAPQLQEAAGVDKMTAGLVLSTVKQLYIGQGQESNVTPMGSIHRERVKFVAGKEREQALIYHEYVMELQQLLGPDEVARVRRAQGLQSVDLQQLTSLTSFAGCAAGRATSSAAGRRGGGREGGSASQLHRAYHGSDCIMEHRHQPAR